VLLSCGIVLLSQGSAFAGDNAKEQGANADVVPEFSNVLRWLDDGVMEAGDVSEESSFHSQEQEDESPSLARGVSQVFSWFDRQLDNGAKGSLFPESKTPSQTLGIFTPSTESSVDSGAVMSRTALAARYAQKPHFLAEKPNGLLIQTLRPGHVIATGQMSKHIGPQADARESAIMKQAEPIVLVPPVSQ